MRLKYLIFALFMTLLVYMVMVILTNPLIDESFKYLIPPVISVVGAYLFTEYKAKKEKEIDVLRNKLFILSNLESKYHLLLNMKSAYAEEKSNPLRCVLLRGFVTGLPKVEKLSQEFLTKIISDKDDFSFYKKVCALEHNLQLIFNLFEERQSLHESTRKEVNNKNLFFPIHRIIEIDSATLGTLFTQTEQLLTLINSQSSKLKDFFGRSDVISVIGSKSLEDSKLYDFIDLKFEKIHFTRKTFNVWVEHVKSNKAFYEKDLEGLYTKRSVAFSLG
ncbi:hypothetical protein N9H48_07055 [Pseudoalteromonas marina]|nr:hypothetical protein [Pseudoalteromonas marina]